MQETASSDVAVTIFSALDVDYTVEVPKQMVPLKRRKKEKILPDKGLLQEQRRVVPEVRNHLQRFTSTFPPQMKAEDVYKRMLPMWRNIMADFFHNYNPSIESAEDCSYKCFRNNTTMTLHADTNLYACWAHGYMHQCKKDFAECKIKHTNKEDSMISCVLSGRTLGPTFGDDVSYRSAGGNPKRTFDYYKSVQKFKNSLNETMHDDHKMENRIEKMTTSSNTSVSIQVQEEVPENVKRIMDEIEKNKENKPNQSPTVINFVARIATAEELDKEALEKKREELATRMHRQTFRYNSDAVVTLGQQAKAVGSKLMRAIVLEVLEDILYNTHTRKLYNQFMRKCTVAAAQKEVEALYSAAVKKRTMACNSDILLILEHYNREFTEILPEVKRDTAQMEGFVTRILWLWRKCNESPLVLKQRARKDPRTDVLIVLPTSDDMCSLRQFSVAMLYYLRDGLTVFVDNSLKKEALLLVAPEESLLFELPPSKDVCYFGTDATEELTYLMARSIFDEAQFNVNRKFEMEQKPAKKRKRESIANVGVTNKSLALIRSESTATALTALTKKGKRASRARYTLEDIANGERSSAHASCRVTSHTEIGAGESITESQLTPFFMKEPMLTGGSSKTRRRVYSEDDIKQAKRFITVSLDSYKHEVVNILD